MPAKDTLPSLPCPDMPPAVDKWDKGVPVEKSSYLRDDKLTYLNEDGFCAEPDKPAMIDLFCGAGGFAEGCSWAGFQSVFGVDHLEPAIRTWSLNHPNALACLGDIKQLDPEDLKRKLAEKGIHDIQLITGGVPCQGFSRANRKHTDEDERNYLFLEYMRFVECFMPNYVILENVSGMRSTAGGRFEASIKDAMENLGYNVSVRLVNAADYGVPQIRQRLLFVGVKKGRGLMERYQFPEGEYVGRHRTVSMAISDLPALGNNESATEYAATPQNSYQFLMRGQGNIRAIRPSARLANHVSPNHPRETIDMIGSTSQGKPMYAKFKQRIRLSEQAPSPTQLAGGIRPQFQFGHPTQPRGLSIRERARIQSFPDSYKFVGGIVQERVQTGNAVPPLLIYNIAKPLADDIQRLSGE